MNPNNTMGAFNPKNAFDKVQKGNLMESRDRGRNESQTIEKFGNVPGNRLH